MEAFFEDLVSVLVAGIVGHEDLFVSVREEPRIVRVTTVGQKGEFDEAPDYLRDPRPMLAADGIKKVDRCVHAGGTCPPLSRAI